MRLKIDSGVHEVDLTQHFQKYALDSQVHYGTVATGEHYKLLTYLSSQLPAGSKIGELGTLYGNAAISLAYNPEVSVFTCDPSDYIKEGTGFKKLPNIQYQKAFGQDILPEVVDAKIIFLDVDPHDGAQEKVIYDKLVSLGFKGLLVCDDINWGFEGVDGMRNFWRGITLPKYDVTQYGHFSGTGIVVFDDATIGVDIS